MDDTCGCAGCCDARALRHAEDRARALRDEVLALKAERDKFKGEALALSFDCETLKRAAAELEQKLSDLKSGSGYQVEVLAGERDNLMRKVEALEASIRDGKITTYLPGDDGVEAVTLADALAAYRELPELRDALKAYHAGKVPIVFHGKREEVAFDELVGAYLDLREARDAIAALAARGRTAVFCPNCRRLTEPVKPSNRFYCRTCMSYLGEEKPAERTCSLADLKRAVVEPGQPIAGELRKSTAHRPCITVAGEDDQGVFMVTVPEARSISFDFK